MTDPDLTHLRQLLARAEGLEAAAAGMGKRIAAQRAWERFDDAAAQAAPAMLRMIEELERENAELHDRLADLRDGDGDR